MKISLRTCVQKLLDLVWLYAHITQRNMMSPLELACSRFVGPLFVVLAPSLSPSLCHITRYYGSPPPSSLPPLIDFPPAGDCRTHCAAREAQLAPTHTRARSKSKPPSLSLHSVLSISHPSLATAAGYGEPLMRDEAYYLPLRVAREGFDFLHLPVRPAFRQLSNERYPGAR